MGYQPVQHPFTPAQQFLLSRGPNLAITPKYHSREAYVAVVEEACSRLPSMEADELRVDTSHPLKNHCPYNKSDVSKEEYKAIR